MRTECTQIREYHEILPELRVVLENLSDHLISDELSWI